MYVCAYIYMFIYIYVYNILLKSAQNYVGVDNCKFVNEFGRYSLIGRSVRFSKC